MLIGDTKSRADFLWNRTWLVMVEGDGDRTSFDALLSGLGDSIDAKDA